MTRSWQGCFVRGGEGGREIERRREGGREREGRRERRGGGERERGDKRVGVILGHTVYK